MARPRLTPDLLCQLAEEAHTTTETVLRVLVGIEVRGDAGERARDALVKHDFMTKPRGGAS